MIINIKFINYFHKIIIILLLILLLIIYHFKSKKYESFKGFTNQKKEPNIEPVIHNYKLYNDNETIFLSLLLNFSNSNTNLLNNTLQDFLTDLSKSVFQDIQIILMYESSNAVILDKSIISFLKRRRIEIFSFTSKIWLNNFFALLNLIKGKFMILINEICPIERDEFKKIYDLTKGTTKNIIKIKNQNNKQFCLLRTKTLRDIMDTENQFHNFKDIIM